MKVGDLVYLHSLHLESLKWTVGPRKPMGAGEFMIMGNEREVMNSDEMFVVIGDRWLWIYTTKEFQGERPTATGA